MRGNAGFAVLCGVAPLPASSGITHTPSAQPWRGLPSQLRIALGRRQPTAGRRTDPGLRGEEDR
jgi:hypothetical protein